MGLPMKLGHGSFPGVKSQHIEPWGDSYIECMEASIDRYNTSNFSTSSASATASLILTSLQYTDVSTGADYVSEFRHSIYSASRQHPLFSISKREFGYRSALVFVEKLPYLGVLTSKASTSHQTAWSRFEVWPIWKSMVKERGKNGWSIR